MEEAFAALKVAARKRDNFTLFGVYEVPDTPELNFNFEENVIAETIQKFSFLEKGAIEAEESEDLSALKKAMIRVKALDELKQCCTDVS